MFVFDQQTNVILVESKLDVVLSGIKINYIIVNYGL